MSLTSLSVEMDAEHEGSGTPPEGTNPPGGPQQTYPGVNPPTGEPTMAQMFQLMQQQTALLMMQNQGGKGKGGFGGESGSTDTGKPVSAKVSDAPEFRGNFDVWLKLIKDWEATHYNMDPKQKPGLVLKGLRGDALALARTAVGDKLNDPGSFQTIVDTLKQYYGTASGLKQFQEFQKLTSVVNSGDNLEQYIRHFDIRREEAREQGLTLPENISVFQLLQNSKLSPGQVSQVLTNAEAIAATQGDLTSGGVKLQYVQQVLRSMSQARNLKVGPGRRERNPAFVGLDGESEWAEGEEDWAGWETGDWDWDDWNTALYAGETWGDDFGEDVEVDEEEQNADPEFLAAAALFRKKFAKSRRWSPVPKGKGGKAGKGGKKGGKQKGLPFPSSSKSKGGGQRQCRFPGFKENGEPKCNNLRDNRKCQFAHTSEELEKARERIKAKGAVPTFNAWDAQESFETLTKSMGSKCVADSGAKKSVVGEHWLKRYERQLYLQYKKRVNSVKLHSSERPRSFQFGGGTKTSIARKRIPFVIDLGEGPEWREMFCDVVPGWLPLLFAYDTMKYNRMVLDTDSDTLLAKTAKGLAQVRNAGLDDQTGILAVDLLNTKDTQWKSTSDCGNKILEADLCMSDGSTCVAALAPLATESQATLFQEACQQALGVEITETARPEVQMETVNSQSQGPSAVCGKVGSVSVGAKVTGHTDTGCGGTVGAAAALLEIVKPKTRRGKKSKNNKVATMAKSVVRCNGGAFDNGEQCGPSTGVTNLSGQICPEKISKSDFSHQHTDQVKTVENPPVVEDVRDTSSLNVQPGTEADIQQAEAESEVGQITRGRPMTKERLRHLHTLTKYALSVTALKGLLKKANCPNLQQALGWYREIVARHPSGRAEYLHRHRLPRLKLRDIQFNEELELDLMELAGRWWLVIADRGTRFLLAVRMPNKQARSARHAFLTRWVFMFGPPVSGISDCGSEFMSREFLELTDLIRMFKECTPAYASDRHAHVERCIRTIREASERSIIGLGRKPTVDELDEIVASVCNQANNDLQACGTTASERAFGRSTYPWLSLLQDPAPSSPEHTQLQEVQRVAREAWRTTVNDRVFQQLLVRQLAPQTQGVTPKQGDLVFYRRPSPLNDGPVYRGPAEVIGISERTEQAFLTHGGLFVRAAFEDLKLTNSRTEVVKEEEEPNREANGGSQALQFEELDDRDGPAAEPPEKNPDVMIVPVPAPRPLEPAAPAATDTAPPAPPSVLGPAGVPSTPTAGSSHPDNSLESVDRSAETHASGVFTIGEASEESEVPEALVEEFAEEALEGDEPPSAAEIFDALSEQSDKMQYFPDTPKGPVAARTPGDWLAGSDPGEDDPTERDIEGPERLHLPDRDVPPDEEQVAPHYGLGLGDRVKIRDGRNWRVGRVFELPHDRPDRVCVEWEAVKRAKDTRFETLNLADHEWGLARTSGRTPAPVSDSERPGLVSLTESQGVSGGADVTVLAAIAALEAKIDRVSGGERQPSTAPPSTRSESRAATVLSALIAHAPLKTRADQVPDVLDGPDCPKHLSRFTCNALLQCLKEWRTWPADPSDKETCIAHLQEIGVNLADQVAGSLYLALADYLDRTPMTATSDTVALEGFRALGRLAGDADWMPPLLSSVETLLQASEGESITPRLIGSVLVCLEQAIATLQGVQRCKVPAFNAVDTMVYEYGEEDLTDKMKLEAAQKELAQFDEFQIWGSDFEAEPPPNATKLDSKYFVKPKVRTVEGKPTLYGKGRLTPKGFQDPEKHLYRVDSPTVSRWVLFVVISWTLAQGWELIKGDISGAFLQGEPLTRENVWIKMPFELVAMGLVPANRLWRRVLKAVYGMNEAPRAWYKAITAAAFALGFVQSLIDPCLLILVDSGKVVCVLVLYVDDLICAGHKEQAAKVMHALAAKYPMGQLEESWKLQSISYTGMDINFHRGSDGTLSSVVLTQEAYVKSKFPGAIKELETALNGHKATAQDLCTARQADSFRSGNGKLAWSGNTRPQNSFEISELASSAKAPTIGDAKKLLKTLRQVLEHAADGITLTKLDPKRLGVVGFGDASFANRGERTQGGFIVLLAEGDAELQSVTATRIRADSVNSQKATGNIAMFRSTKISRVCVGTFDTETIEAVETVDASTCVAYLLSELKNGRLPSIAERVLLRGFGDVELPPPDVWIEVESDGKGTVSAVHSTRPVSNKRRRIDIALLREMEERGFVGFRFCPTEKMLADGLTKGMCTSAIRQVAVTNTFELPI